MRFLFLPAMLPSITRVLALVTVLVSTTGAATGPVTIEVVKPRVEYKTYDPRKPPDPPPPVDPGEDAACLYHFTLHANLSYSTKVPPGAARAVATVTAVNITLNLEVTIWLPDTASDHLKAHEEGHRTIAETFYKDAEQTVRPLAAKLIGHTFAAPAKDLDQAGDAAVGRLIDTLVEDYLQAINNPTGKAQKVFDDLTDHGRKRTPTTEEAVKKAIEAGRRKD